MAAATMETANGRMGSIPHSILESSALQILDAQVTSDILLRIRSAGIPPRLTGASNQQIPCESADRLHRPLLRETETSTLSTRTSESRTGRTEGLQLSVDPPIFVFPPSKMAPENESRERMEEETEERIFREKNKEMALERSSPSKGRKENTDRDGEQIAEEREERKNGEGEERETKRTPSTKRT